jgi:hypothetical protein
MIKSTNTGSISTKYAFLLSCSQAIRVDQEPQNKSTIISHALLHLFNAF